jgi:protein-S-isoprenylcysteine O-methyltransferase Ste14
MKEQKDEVAGVIAPPPLIYGSALGLGVILHLLFPLRLMPDRPRSVRRPLGIALIVAGLLPALWAALTMFRQGNNPEPSHPVASLVVDGPFRISRNPIYLSMTTSYLGAGFLFGTFWHMLLLPVLLTIMRRGVVEREEAYLAQRFGEDYETYRASVRRWI